MLIFKRLTQTNGQQIDVNMAMVSSMEQFDGFTRLALGQGSIEVKETADHIAMAPALRFNSTFG